MNLYISSFNNKLSKSIILAFVGFCLYSFALQIIHPNITYFQNQWVGNYSAAEKYIYAQSPVQLVIVGSSMAARLPATEFNSEVHNLSFSGGSVLTGLSIIKRSKILPKTILIETNIVERPLNVDMVNSLFAPIIWQMKEKLVSLRYTYQSINIFLTFIKNSFGHSEESRTNEDPNKKILESALKRHVEATKSSKYLIDNKELGTLQKLIYYFEDRGVKIIFFQMPVNRKILVSRQYSFRKSILLKMFPNAKFHWIKIDDADNYQTSDGVHLMHSSAVKFSSVLNKYFILGSQGA